MQLNIGIVGMTHLGLITAISFAAKGFTILGFDKNPALIKELKVKNFHLMEPDFLELYEANKSLSGSISFTNIYDRNLEFSINYDVNGQVLITGIISSTTDFGNSLNFEFMSDQSYIQSTLIELDIIAKKYGDKRN